MKNLTLLIKPSSSLCNMRCKYCFYEDESQNRTLKSYGTMTDETTRKLIESAYSCTKSGSDISFCFQGGEPTLLGLDFYKNFIEEEKKHPERNYHHSIQTNGFAIDKNWAEFFKKNNFLVGISVDGYQALHDLHRIDASGNGTFERIKNNIEILKEHEVDINALCVVTKQCAEKPHRVYQRLKDMGFRYLQFISCLDPIGKERGLEPYSLLPQEYGTFLCTVFDDWYRDWENGDYVSIRQFEDYVHLMLGMAPSSCASMGKCGVYLVVEGDGSLYPCDFYVLDEYRIGNINEMSLQQAIDCRKSVEFRTTDVPRPDKCHKCNYFSICHGGCKRDLFVNNRETDNYYCQSFKMFFEYAGQRLTQIASEELKLLRKQ